MKRPLMYLLAALFLIFWTIFATIPTYDECKARGDTAFQCIYHMKMNQLKRMVN